MRSRKSFVNSVENFHNSIEARGAFASSLSAANTINLLMERYAIKFMSSTDIAYVYGQSRQYWEKLMTSKQIPYYVCSAGRFTLNIYVEGYLIFMFGKEYVQIVKRTVKEIRRRLRKGYSNGEVVCPRCDSKNMCFALSAPSKAVKASCKLCGYKLSFTPEQR